MANYHVFWDPHHIFRLPPFDRWWWKGRHPSHMYCINQCIRPTCSVAKRMKLRFLGPGFPGLCTNSLEWMQCTQSQPLPNVSCISSLLPWLLRRSHLIKGITTPTVIVATCNYQRSCYYLLSLYFMSMLFISVMCIQSVCVAVHSHLIVTGVHCKLHDYVDLYSIICPISGLAIYICMFALMSPSSNLPIPLFISHQLHLIYFCLSTMSDELGFTPDEAIFEMYVSIFHCYSYLIHIL